VLGIALSEALYVLRLRKRIVLHVPLVKFSPSKEPQLSILTGCCFAGAPSGGDEPQVRPLRDGAAVISSNFTQASKSTSLMTL
jgi:hypothetical protein